jgi:hypothetical protein
VCLVRSVSPALRSARPPQPRPAPRLSLAAHRGRRGSLDEPFPYTRRGSPSCGAHPVFDCRPKA